MGNGLYCLQPTTAVEPFELQQKVDTYFKNRHETMITEVEVKAEGMQLIGLTPFGHKLVQISYNNQAAQAAVSPNTQIEPALMIAMIQLALWPADSVRKGLGASLRVEDSVGHRRYMTQDKIVLDIDYASTKTPHNKLHLSFPDVGLELSIETLPKIENTL